jgi:hypothetical protein
MTRAERREQKKSKEEQPSWGWNHNLIDVNSNWNTTAFDVGLYIQNGCPISQIDTFIRIEQGLCERIPEKCKVVPTTLSNLTALSPIGFGLCGLL